MKLSILNRKVHYWASLVVAAPIVIVAATGILLQLKKQLAWVQPPEQRGGGRQPTLAWDELLERCRDVPEAGIETWADIHRIDVRPGRGMMKVWARSGWEVQLDIQTGQLLQVAYRRSDLIEAIHDGSFFGDVVKYGLFLPAALVLVLMWLTGVYLFILPFWVRARRRPAAGVAADA